MADFDLTRAEAKSSIHVLMGGFVYHTPLGMWEHDETGAWICIEHVADNPSMMIVLWRAMPAWGQPNITMVASFQDTNEETAWKRALNIAETAFEKGPKGKTREQAIIISGNYKRKLLEGRTKAGQKSGEVRSEKAATLKTEFEAVTRKYPFIKNRPFKPKYDPKIWMLDAPETMERCSIQFENRKGAKTFISLIVPTDNPNEIQVWRGWHMNGNEDNGMTHERMATYDASTGDDSIFVKAQTIMERLLVSDPARWQQGDTSTFTN